MKSNPNSPHFNGPDYQAEMDFGRLTTQHARVKECMRDGEWRRRLLAS